MNIKSLTVMSSEVKGLKIGPVEEGATIGTTALVY
jgi:hypothetical protein